jgi:hypothetical protein
MIVNNKWCVYLSLIFLFVLIGGGIIYLNQDKDNQTTETEQDYEDNILSTLKPAPEGYVWYITKKAGGFAFLYPDISRVDICGDPALCTVLGTLTGGIIIDNNNLYKTIPGGKDGGYVWKRDNSAIEIADMYPKGLSVTYMDTESRMVPEKAEESIREYYVNEKKVEPIIFHEASRGVYSVDYTKPLPPVFLITRVGVFKISTLANELDSPQRRQVDLCHTKFSKDYCLQSGVNYDDYAELPKYINTIVQSFTVLD